MMEINEVRWTVDLEAGIESLDEQHREYFYLLNNYLAKATEVNSQAADVMELAETLSFLRRYAKEHFSDEERVMKEVDYPDFESHHKEHEYFLRHVQELYESMRFDGFSPDLSREVHYYTVEWFMEHIHLTDMNFVQFLKQRSVDEPSFQPFFKRVLEFVSSKGNKGSG